MISLLKQVVVFIVVIFTTTFLGCQQVSFANPVGGIVTSGNAGISNPSANHVLIQQSTDKAIINWQSYNVKANEHVNYQQPSTSSITLNRINPHNGPSDIFGKISANGQVWLINPAGIWIGRSAIINVGGLVATTADINDSDFLNGNYHFVQSPDWRGMVVNEGRIHTSKAGLVALVGNGVVNNGFIEANLGTVILASGQEYTVHFSGNNLIGFTVDRETIQPAVDRNGSPVRTAVKNSGTLLAAGGKIFMEAKTAGQILDESINMNGVAVARSVGTKNGEIVFEGSENVNVSGSIDASGPGQGAKGGSVRINGKNVIIQRGSKIDTSGDSGGGQILIGGDYQGKNPQIKNAQRTLVDKDVILKADAKRIGDGGTVIVWADDTTLFDGKISAKGGRLSGNGGLIETSGKDYLQIGDDAAIDASAPHGLPGTWLLDPRNVTITTTTTGGAFGGGNPDIFTPIADNATVAALLINTTLNLGTSVTITTGGTGTQAGNITVSSAITKSLISLLNPTLTLNAANNITINSGISSSVGPLNVSLIGGNTVTVGAAINTNGGSFNNSSSTFTVNNTISTAGGAFVNASSAFTVNNTISTAGGAFANASSTFNLNSTISTAGGNFSSTTQNATTLGNAAGTTPGTINAGSGTITLAVNADGAGANNFLMNLDSAITTTNTAANAVAINVNAAAGGTGNATLRAISTGSGGGITVATDTGGNTTGTDITYGGAGTLDTGAGTITLTTPKGSGKNIATSGSPLQIKAANLNATSGGAGIFIINTGTPSLTVDTLRAVNTSNVGIGAAQIFSNTAIIQGTNSVAATTLTLKTLNNAGAAITFNNSANAVTTVNLQARTANDLANAAGAITYRDTDGFAIAAVNTDSTATLTAGGDITQTGAIATTGLTTFTLTAPSSVTLDNAANNLQTTPVFSSNILDLSFTNTATNAVIPTIPSGIDDLTFVFSNAGMTLPTINLTGALTLTAKDAITQTASTSLSGTTLTAKTLNDSSGANIILNNLGNNFTTINLQARNSADTANQSALINYADTTGFNVTGMRTTNNATFTAGGAITDGGVGFTVGGTTTVAAGSNAVTLDVATNDFNTVVISNAGNTTLVDANALILGASNISGTLSVTAAGAITQSGALSVTNTASFTAGATNDITLTNSANNFNTFRAITGRNVNAVDTDAITLGASTVSGTLAVTAASIAQNGTLTVTGLPTFTVTNANSNILLGTNNNDFSTTPIFNGSIANLSLKNISATAAMPIIPSGLQTLNLEFTQNGMTLPTIDLSGAASSLTLTAGNAITQGVGTHITGVTLTAETNKDLGAAITLANSGNDFSTISLQSRNAADNADANGVLQYTDISGFDIASLRTTGNATLIAAGNITDSGSSIIGGTMSYTAGSANNITVNTATNNFNIAKVISANNVTLRDTNAIVLDTSNISGTFSLTTAGDVTQSGTLAVSGATTIAAGSTHDITLTNSSNDFSSIGITSARAVNIHDVNDLILAASTVADTYQITSGGSLTQSGILSITGTPTFTLTAANSDITLNTSANNFAVSPIFSNNGNIRNISLRNVNAAATFPTLPTGLTDLTLVFNNAGISFPNLTLSGNLNVTAGGNVSMSNGSAKLIVAGTTTIAAGATHDVTLNNTDNDFANVAITTARNVTLNDTNAIAFATSDVSGNLTVTANGQISQTGSIAVDDIASFSSGMSNDIILPNAANAFHTVKIIAANNAELRNNIALALDTSDVANDLTVTATSITQLGNLSGVRLTAKTRNNAGGNITLNTNNNDFDVINLQSRNTADTANDTGTIAYSDVNGFSVERIATANTGANALTLSSSGDISSSGPVVVNGTANISAGATHDIDLTNSSNGFSILKIANAHDALITDANNIVLGASNLSGSYTINALGTVTQNASLTVSGTLAVVAIGGITLNDANVVSAFNASNSGSGAISFTNTSPSLTLTGIDQTASGAVDISTSGLLAVANNTTVNTHNADLNLNASDLDLNSSGSLNAGAGEITIIQNTSNGSIALGNTAGSMTISGDELQRIFANRLNLTPGFNGNILINGVTDVQAQNINEVVANATNGSLSAITMLSSPSSFNQLTSNANDGITINGDVAAMNGQLIFNADVDNIVATNDAINLGNVAIEATSSLTMTAFNGGINLLGSPTLNANGITINNVINGAQTLTLNSANSDINFDAAIGNTVAPMQVKIVNAKNVTFNSAMNVNNYLQQAGSGITNFVTALNAANNASITTNRLIGNLAVRSLTINLATGEMFGTVNNKSGVNAIKLITVLNRLQPNKIFFDGIDIYDILKPVPVPPIPPLPPEPNINTDAQIIFPTNYQSPSASLFGLKPSLAEKMLHEANTPVNNLKRTGNCFSLNSLVQICGLN